MIRHSVSIPGETGPGHRAGLAARILSVAGAALVLAGGYVHYCLYRNGYRFIPKIGVSFLLQAGASLAVAAGLVAMSFGGRTRQSDRLTVVLRRLFRAAGVLLSAGTLGALAIAHTSQGLFDFR